MAKICKKCGASKEIADFPKRKSSPDGVRNECKECTNDAKRSWDAQNGERKRQYHERYVAKNPEAYRLKCAANSKASRLKDPERARAAYMKWYFANKEKAYAATRRWLDAHPDHRAAYNERARLEGKSSAWQKANPAKSAAKTRRYQARKVMACPPWLTDLHHDQICALYEEAARLSLETGIQHHVDHIFPLKGKNFSGLHVPWNLRVISATDNMSKGNRVVRDMTEIVEIFQ